MPAPDPENGAAHPTIDGQPLVGWREWLALPGLGIRRVKAKIDTGARSSALHAFGFERFRAGGTDRVRFQTVTRRAPSSPTIECEAEVLDIRTIRSSNGAIEDRYVVSTPCLLAGKEWPIELTLSNRRAMKFRMLLGREALRRRFLVDPGRSFIDPTHRPRPRSKGPLAEAPDTPNR